MSWSIYLRNYIKYICIFYTFFTLRGHNIFEIVVVKRTRKLIFESQYHGYWCFVQARSQGIKGHVCLEYSGFSIKRVQFCGSLENCHYWPICGRVAKHAIDLYLNQWWSLTIRGVTWLQWVNKWIREWRMYVAPGTKGQLCDCLIPAEVREPDRWYHSTGFMK